MERQSYSPRIVLSAIAATLGVAFLVALYIQGRFARYEPRAVEHLPEGVELAVWLNVEQTIGFDLFEEYLLPVVEFERTEREPRLKQLERKTTLELEVDTREVVFALLDESTWLAVLGGLYRRDGVMDGLARAFAEHEISLRTGQGLGISASGFAFGVADDGSLVLSNRADVARRALTASADSRELKALLNKPGTLLNVVALSRTARFSGRRLLSERERRAWLSIEPGNPFPFFAQLLEVDGAPPSGLQQYQRQLPFEIKDLRQVPGPHGIVHLTGRLPADELARAMERFETELVRLVWAGPTFDGP